MKKQLAWSVVAVSLLVLVGSGCATSRGVMSLEVPAVEQAASPKAGPGVFLRSVKDVRTFEDRPKDPSIPSLKGGLGRNAEEVKLRAIARKRNSYGAALGDILLPEGQSVEMVVRDLLLTSLAKLGYRIAEDDKAPGTVVVDASIDRFWSWFTPGFWAISLEAEIQTNLAIQKDGKTEQAVIKGYGKKKGQAATTGSWQKVYRAAMDDYLLNANTVLSPKLQ